jgi:hypothetical protein
LFHLILKNRHWFQSQTEHGGSHCTAQGGSPGIRTHVYDPVQVPANTPLQSTTKNGHDISTSWTVRMGLPFSLLTVFQGKITHRGRESTTVLTMAFPSLVTGKVGKLNLSGEFCFSFISFSQLNYF